MSKKITKNVRKLNEFAERHNRIQIINIEGTTALQIGPDESTGARLGPFSLIETSKTGYQVLGKDDKHKSFNSLKKAIKFAFQIVDEEGIKALRKATEDAPKAKKPKGKSSATIEV